MTWSTPNVSPTLLIFAKARGETNPLSKVKANNLRPKSSFSRARV
jgi:hypothetical protein